MTRQNLCLMVLGTLALGMALQCMPRAEAQLTTVLGTQGTGNSFPFNYTAGNGRWQTAYAAVDLQIPAGSLISEIRVFGSAVAAPTYTNMQFRFAYTTLGVNAMTGSFDTNYTGTLTTALQGNVTPTITAGTGGNWYHFTMGTPFVYDGSSTLVMDVSYDARSAAGPTVSTSVPATTEQPRSRVYLSGGGATSPTGTAAASQGNFGITFVYLPAGNGVVIGNQTSLAGLGATGNDIVMMNLVLTAFGQNQTLNSITFTKTGTSPNSIVTNAKLVRDDNNNGQVDATDTVLGQGVPTTGTVTFSGAPLQAVTTAAAVRVLLAVTYTQLVSPQTLGFSVPNAAAVTWSGGTDHTGYPLNSGPYTVLLAGLIRVANGNPGSAFDFGDLGDVFNALETVGMAGPVTIELFDDGGAFTSNANYQLGGNMGTLQAIPGSSATNTITVRAAAGETPVIQGSGASNPFSTAALGTMSLYHVSNISFEGLTITGGVNYGIMVYSSASASSTNISIRRCKIHGITTGGAIFFYGNSGGSDNVTIENNMIWNCGGDAGSNFSSGCKGLIGARRNGLNWQIRHNSILHTNGLAGSSIFFQNGNNIALDTIRFNTVYLTNPSAVPYLRQDASATLLPTNVDRNVVFLGGAAIMATQATVNTWALWQAAGKDTNGVNADPLYTDIASAVDLHLQLTSPAIDLAVGSTTAADIDGDVRPIGPAPDAGADEAFTGPPPSMEVKFGTTVVADGGNVGVGNVPLAGLPFTFTIENMASALGDLILTANPAVQITLGTNCDAGTIVQSQPALTTITASNSTTFTVFADPTNLGAFDFTLVIPNNDPLKNPYNFTVAGNGVPNNAAAVANPTAGSAFIGPTNGPFVLAIDPGVALVGAGIELSDAESDNITVISITQPTPAATGINTPAIPVPGHPIVLNWTGTPAGANPPGNYTWVVEFEDAVNGTPILIDVTITINDALPVHGPVAGQAGTGTVADPYVGEYTESITGLVTLDLANVSDPNTAQVVTISNQARTGGNAGNGTGFQFALAAGVLRAAPAGALIAADVGTQEYTITVTDGTSLVDIIVLLTTNELPSFVTAALPDAIQNSPYTQNVMTAGGTGGNVVTLTGGTLPIGIILSATGTLAGMTTDAPATFNFILTVTDSLGANSNQAFSLTVVAPAGGVPVITSPAQLPSAPLNATYGPVALQVTGGVAPYTWAVTGGTLPIGLVMSAAGEISGTATVLGSTAFTVTVTDSASVSGVAALTIEVVAAPTGGDGGGGGGGGTCVATTGGSMLALLALLPALAHRRRK